MLKATIKGWRKDKASTLAAALAFYATFSLAPLLVIMMAIAGLIFRDESVRDLMLARAAELVGPEGAQAIQTMMDNTTWPGESLTAAAIGIIALLFGASAVFIHLTGSLNIIRKVKPKTDRGFFGITKGYF